MSETTYRIVRFQFGSNRRPRVIHRAFTLEQAQAHCKDPETSSSTCTSATGKQRTRQVGEWFEGYEVEGSRPNVARRRRQ